MNLTEQKLWTLIKDHLPGDVSRVENSVDDGMPDINGTWLVDYWIELKVCENISKIRDVTLMLRDSQMVWNIRRGKQGCIIFVLVRYSTFMILYQWDNVIFANKINNIPNAYIELCRINKTGSFDWNLLELTLKERIKNGLCCPRM
jgi:hypothetical protein